MTVAITSYGYRWTQAGYHCRLGAGGKCESGACGSRINRPSSTAIRVLFAIGVRLRGR